MSDIQNEVIQLCDSILIFEKYMNKLKQQLFLFPEVCDTLIWNHIIGGQTKNVQKENFMNFLQKNHLQFSTKTVDLLIYEYSTKRQTYLTREQFIFIFIDQRRTGIYEIMQMKKKKFGYANNHVPHIKISEMLIEILKLTLEFLQTKQKMKQNIYAVNKQLNFNLEKVDPQHFLIFINKYQPLWGIEDCDIVLDHIFKLKKKQLKQFYFFFVPYECKSKKLNPDNKILTKIQSLEMKETYSSIIDHKKASHFGNKNIKLKKTLYLK